jgi:AraC-like DNA-binding protein
MTRIEDIAALIERFTDTDGVHQTAIDAVRLGKSTAPGLPHRGVHEPSFCLIAQGTKRVMLADEIYLYDRSRFLVASVDLPVTGQVIQASAEQPYLGFVLRLDPAEVAEVALQARITPPADAATMRGLFVAQPEPELLDAIARLIRLLEAPADIPALAPLVQRELLYRVLRSEHGWRIAQMVAAQGHSHRIRNAISWLRTHFAEPLHIETFARRVNMSPSTLHHHFKAVTAMSPLQYQKQLRLQEARRLLMGEGVDAATAGHRVGYESASQFSREYSRLFGAPPARDLKRLRAAPQVSAAA